MLFLICIHHKTLLDLENNIENLPFVERFFTVAVVVVVITELKIKGIEAIESQAKADKKNSKKNANANRTIWIDDQQPLEPYIKGTQEQKIWYKKRENI